MAMPVDDVHFSCSLTTLPECPCMHTNAREVLNQGEGLTPSTRVQTIFTHSCAFSHTPHLTLWPAFVSKSMSEFHMTSRTQRTNISTGQVEANIYYIELLGPNCQVALGAPRPNSRGTSSSAAQGAMMCSRCSEVFLSRSAQTRIMKNIFLNLIVMDVCFFLYLE